MPKGKGIYTLGFLMDCDARIQLSKQMKCRLFHIEIIDLSNMRFSMFSG